MPALRMHRVRGREDAQQEPCLAQAMLQLFRLPKIAGLYQPQRRAKRRDLLQRLLRPKLRTTWRRLRYWCRCANDGINQNKPLTHQIDTLIFFFILTIKLCVFLELPSSEASRLDRRYSLKSLFISTCIFRALTNQPMRKM